MSHDTMAILLEAVRLPGEHTEPPVAPFMTLPQWQGLMSDFGPGDQSDELCAQSDAAMYDWAKGMGMIHVAMELSLSEQADGVNPSTVWDNLQTRVTRAMELLHTAAMASEEMMYP